MLYNIKIAKFVVGYIWVTYILFLISPISYINITNTKISYLNVTIFLMLASVSFFLGCKSIPIIKQNLSKNIYPTYPFFNAILYISFIISILMVIDGILQPNFNLSRSLGEIYRSNVSDKQELSVSRIGQIYILFSPIIALTTAVGFYNLPKFTRNIKFLFITTVILMLFYKVFFLGTQKGVGDIIIIMISSLIIKGLQMNNLKKYFKTVAYSILLFIVFFIITTISRNNAYETSGLIENKYFIIYPNNWIYTIYGKQIGEGMLSLIIYVSHGYQGLTYCLELPFEWTYGYGNSMALSSYIQQYFHTINMVDYTYPLRMEKITGWPGTMFWPTAFSWWASDITFPGVIFLMYIIGRFFCICFKEAYQYSNPISITILSYLSILIVYLPANNQILQTRQSFLGFIVLLIIWLFRHRKINLRNYIQIKHI